MKVKQTGLNACSRESYGRLTAKDVETLRRMIDDQYRVNLFLDNLPVTVYDLLDGRGSFLRPGFELGFKRGDKYFINNHLIFNVLVYRTYGNGTLKHGTDARSLITDSRGNHQHRHMLTAATGEAAAAARRQSGDDTAIQHTPADAGRATTGDDYSVDPARYMVVGFEVSPCSIAHKPGEVIKNVACNMGDDISTAQEITEGADTVYTYDVYWQDSKIKWASRWDAYLRMPGGKVHWFSIINSLLVVLVMATIVAMILVRTVRRDLAKYEAMVVEGGVAPGGTALDAKEEAGWKLVAGDVFRAPTSASMLAVQVGTGVQILVAALITLILATLGFLSPAARGALLTAGIILFVLLAGLSGFVACYVWGVMERSYNGWQGVAARTSIYYPAVNMAIFTVLNMVIVHTGSTGAVPVGIYFSLVAMWFFISIPLTFMGGMLAVRMPLLDWPVKTNQTPRHLPPAPLAANPTLLFLAAGVLPFGAVHIELYFAMTSLWLGYFYNLSGFMLLVGLLTCIISVEVSVLCTYVQLRAEDYTWWWRSFHRGGSVSLYVALYALHFLASNTGAYTGCVAVFIYLCYMTTIVLASYCAMGTLGFGASLWFAYLFYKAMKVD